MTDYFELFWQATTGYFNWFVGQITFSTSDGLWGNYFYFLMIISLTFFGLELINPWRKEQPKFRQDFWLDAFYMFFNFFLFSIVAFAGLSHLAVEMLNDFLALIGIANLMAIQVGNLPAWVQLLLLFVVKDFIEWTIHRLLHWSPWLWEFHKVHHSVKQMGFAAHLRYHWMENVVYKSLEYIPLALIGFSLSDFFLVHAVAIAIGHWNHANFNVNIGPLKYIFNNPAMHIWHHAKDLPGDRKFGVNFGLSLSVWDYLFGTNYIPKDGKDIELGFPNDENFPSDFVRQNLKGFGIKKEN
ncbi:Sterol desaturase/sphingolipid hydroxylase, fatty acid hydroxylase superfamily [Reichenbachiella faecimaris]|uniref:Sterol desaturase/sphingolipid hydroxylase, fatty acid hydroxylase superfamily n=1 Tax=Reichenbachiella faecimaris TaxID=692418 RepID=A0A1W2GRI6_REIFA|nr:sterol desaturase family protein [Reichenbachiella faecimaris]SMD38866.1 Sterol desaturase/sphingolipid hydroxylase, fatty acid hydroxylase superfamily [Reichenbachiella faecimaris]